VVDAFEAFLKREAGRKRQPNIRCGMRLGPKADRPEKFRQSEAELARYAHRPDFQYTTTPDDATDRCRHKWAWC